MHQHSSLNTDSLGNLWRRAGDQSLWESCRHSFVMSALHTLTVREMKLSWFSLEFLVHFNAYWKVILTLKVSLLSYYSLEMSLQICLHVFPNVKYCRAKNDINHHTCKEKFISICLSSQKGERSKYLFNISVQNFHTFVLFSYYLLVVVHVVKHVFIISCT